jgi:hypothetical protein
MAAPQFSSPPRPRRVLQIGVTGHRLNRISPAMAAVLPEKCEQALAAILKAWAVAGPDLAGAEEPAQVRVISPLAEGADRMVASAGLGMGAELACPLPFHADEYRRDFASEESRQEFDALLARAAVVFGAGGRREAAEAAYERAGQIVVEQSDVLIAVWDGEASRGRGGTAQMVDEALALGVPVVWLHAIDPQEACVLSAGAKGKRRCAPLGAAQIFSAAGKEAQHSEQAQAAAAVSRASLAYFREQQHGFDAAWLFRWFRDLVAEGRLWPGPMRIADFEENARKEWSAAIGDRLPEATRRYLLDKLCPHYSWADGLSQHYAGLLRSGSVLANLCAASAVFFALAGPLADSIDLWNSRIHGASRDSLLLHWFNRLPSLIEFLLIAVILLIIYAGQRRQWHQRWLRYRQLAERLRQSSYLWPLGCALLKVREAPHSGSDLNRGWVDGMYHAIARDIGLVPGSVEPAYVLAVSGLMEKILEGQIRYHQRNHEKLEKLNHRLHLAGAVLFAVTLAACVAHVILGGEAAWLLMLATAPPALGAALYAIASQGEFARSADRSLAMSRELAALQSTDLPQALDARGAMLAEVRKVALSVAEVMTAETNDWNLVFKYRPLHLPG